MKSKLLKIFICLLICVGGGWLSGRFSSPQTHWYAHLVKSPLTPPNISFPIVWTILYILMGIALYRIWISPKKKKTSAVVFFVLQLFFNFLWTFLFFSMQKPGIALLDIFLLGVSLIVTMVLFYRISRLATYLLLPYLIWILFAFYLNWYIWVNNQ